MAVKPDIELSIRSDPRLLQAVRGMMQGYIQSCGFSEERASEIVLAVDEACTNAMRHAYGGRTDELFALSVRSSNEWIEIELQDKGHPAPADKTCRKELTAPDPAHLEAGGLGVQLIYEVCDEADFSPGDPEGNTVTMRLKRPQE